MVVDGGGVASRIPEQASWWGPVVVWLSGSSPRPPMSSQGLFHARLPWQGMVKFYKGSIFVITETQFAIQSHVA